MTSLKMQSKFLLLVYKENWITSLKLNFLFRKLATSTKLLLTSLSHIVFWILHEMRKKNFWKTTIQWKWHIMYLWICER